MPPLNNTPGTNHDYKKVEMIIKMSLNHINIIGGAMANISRIH